MKGLFRAICLLGAVWLLGVGQQSVWAAQAAAAQRADRFVELSVVDEQGLPVAGALVTLAVKGAAGKEIRSTSAPVRVDGLTAEVYDLRVQADGFASRAMTVDLRTQSASGLEVRLEPAGLAEQVIVTATRGERRLGDVPASVSILTDEHIDASPALVADDVLRQVPSFSLFRRTSSLVAQPTTQGVSLRGIGPSGQSRTLVLLDGIPFNDPFGGWVYWTRVPLVSVDRIEVTEDTTSSLYGNYAMGGVINIITARPARRTIEFKPQYGSRGTPKFDFFASDRWNKVGVAVEGGFFNTDGFPIVAPRERGPIDNNANVNYRNVSVKFEYAPSDRVRTFVRTGYFTEDRVNGKVGEMNDTRWTTVNGGVEARLRDDSNLEARMFVDRQRAHFNFLAVTNAATTRNVVRLATDQFVPTNGVGTTVQWTKSVHRQHLFSAGMDWRWVDGDSQEDAYVAAVPTVITGVTQQARLNIQRISGGTQQSVGAFVQDIFTPTPKLVFTLSARVDRWRSYDGHNLETTVATGLPTANHNPALPDKTDTVVSPHAAALYRVSDRVSIWGAANSGFRAPTLTELYRQFSVGAITTRPNNQLGPERLVGGEIGVNVSPARNVSARVTWFDNRLTNPISNVTQSATLAQKQNLGRTRVRGVQMDADYRVGSAWRFSGAYLFEEAKVTDGGVANAGLVGKYLQQVPRHRGSFQIAYSDSRVATVAFGVQFIGLQYNDDQNVQFIPPATLTEAGYDAALGLGLPGYGTADLMVSRDLGRNLQLFFGVQNLFDQAYFVQTNPSTTGTPRLVNGGVRVRFAGR
jgi:outer membrane receptor protein involved in Fe transport